MHTLWGLDDPALFGWCNVVEILKIQVFLLILHL